MSVENLAILKTVGVINAVNPLAYAAKGFMDVPVRYSETFTFRAKGNGFKSIDAHMLESDCHHYEIKKVKNELKEK